MILKSRINKYDLNTERGIQLTLSGQTITLFLMDDDVSGRIKCTIAGWTGVVYKIPRKDLDMCKERAHLKQSGVYFLFGSSDLSDDRVIYIGQAAARKNGEGLLGRLLEHRRNPEKDYWTEAVAITTTDDSFGATEISYLESRFCQLAKQANRFDVKNDNDPPQGHPSEEKESELEHFIEFVKIILGTLGYKAFVPVNEDKEKDQRIQEADSLEEALLCLKTSKAHAKGKRTSEGFVVLKDSSLSAKPTKSCPISIQNLRAKYADRIDAHNVLTEDTLFSSPSMAAGFVNYASTSGLTSWCTGTGKTLKQIEAE